MHLGHNQLRTVLFFQIYQYFPFAEHICCPLQLNLCFHKMVLKYMSLCVT